MPLVKMPFQPGVDKQATEYGAEGKWFDSDNMRFRYGLPEKIGGWIKVTTDALIGATRGILTWFSNEGDQYTIIGTNKKLYVYANGAWSDITPIRSPTNAITNITTNVTASTSSNVTITDAAHGAITGDFVTISGTPGAVNGITQTQLLGEFEIIEVISTSQYVITTPGTATSAGSAAVTGTNASYELNTKPAVSVAGYGWGTGTWGLSTWGTSRAGITGAEAVQLDSGKWSFDNYGEDVLCQQFNGGLYYWDTSGGVTVPATVTPVSNAPTRSRFVLLSGTDRFVLCFGTETTIGTTSSQDDMLIRWSQQDDPNIWIPTSTNTAGFQRLTDGSRLISATRSRGAVLIWSDTAMYQMQLVGAPLVFGFTQLGAKCGSAGLHATVDVNGTAYWMGRDSFFGFDGKVSKIPCSVEDYVFGDIDEASQKDTFAAANSEFNEVTWFYCSDGSSQINRCVTYNYEEKVWNVGTLNRTSWADKGVYNFPYATSYDATNTSSTITTINGLTPGRTFMYAQENGMNADGAAMISFVESGSFVIPQAGEKLMSIKKFIPDFKNLAGTVDVSLRFRLYPASEQVINGPHEVINTTEFVSTRARGRQAAVRIESNTLNSTWRYGTYRADVQQDGMR